MNVPSYLKPALTGAVIGAAALAIVGFSWGGWVTLCLRKLWPTWRMPIDTIVRRSLSRLAGRRCLDLTRLTEVSPAHASRAWKSICNS